MLEASCYKENVADVCWVRHEGAIAVDIDELQSKIDRLESRQAIEDLASLYCHGFDKRDEARFLSIWWEDCVWAIGPPFGDFAGHGGILSALHDVLWPAWDMSQHITSNQVVEFSDPDHAIACCDVDCTGLLAGSPDATFVGATYTDQVERRQGIWKIRRRDVAIHYFNSFKGDTLSKPE